MPKRFAPPSRLPGFDPQRGTPLAHLISTLRRHGGTISVELLRSTLDALPLSIEDVRAYIHLDPRTYARNVVARYDEFEIMVFCWQPGQKSPIHDHAGSACGVRVVSGTATETLFELLAPGRDLVRPVPNGTGEMRTGQVTAAFDSDIHEIANNDPDGELLVTLHVYAPPLKSMNSFQAAPIGAVTGCST